MSTGDLRLRILETAAELFYTRGAHVVGVDEIVERAGVAKSSLYRHFRTKDDLIAAYVAAEDAEFWRQWDAVVQDHDDPVVALRAVINWIAGKISSESYRGCPHLNISAELADPTHPARSVAARHKSELRRRIADLVEQLDVDDPATGTDALWLLLDGAFANHDQLNTGGRVGDRLLAAARSVTGASL